MGPIPGITLSLSRNLECSTAHISRQDSELLDLLARNARGWPPVFELGYGWLLGVPSEAESLAELKDSYHGRGASKSLLYLLELAQSEKCSHLLIDQEGPVYDCFPTFEW